MAWPALIHYVVGLFWSARSGLLWGDPALRMTYSACFLRKQETLILGHSSRKKLYFSGHRLCFRKPVYPQSHHIPRLREESPFPLGVGSMRGKSELGMCDSKLSGTWEEGIDDLGWLCWRKQKSAPSVVTSIEEDLFIISVELLYTSNVGPCH